MKLEYELINDDNIKLAISIQGLVFPGECAIEHYCYSISTNYKNCAYYIIKFDNIPVGITGMYILDMYSKECVDKDDVWLGWYGVLPEFRSRGIGKQSLLDTMKMASKFNRKYFRLYTINTSVSTAYSLYEKVMQLREVYKNTDYDKDYIDKYAIYSYSLSNDQVLSWNNRCAYISDDCKMCEVSNEKLKESYKILFDCNIKADNFMEWTRVATFFRKDGTLVYVGLSNLENEKFDIIISEEELNRIINYSDDELKGYKNNIYDEVSLK